MPIRYPRMRYKVRPKLGTFKGVTTIPENDTPKTTIIILSFLAT